MMRFLLLSLVFWGAVEIPAIAQSFSLERQINGEFYHDVLEEPSGQILALGNFGQNRMPVVVRYALSGRELIRKPVPIGMTNGYRLAELAGKSYVLGQRITSQGKLQALIVRLNAALEFDSLVYASDSLRNCRFTAFLPDSSRSGYWILGQEWPDGGGNSMSRFIWHVNQRLQTSRFYRAYPAFDTSLTAGFIDLLEINGQLLVVGGTNTEWLGLFQFDNQGNYLKQTDARVSIPGQASAAGGMLKGYPAGIVKSSANEFLFIGNGLKTSSSISTTDSNVGAVYSRWRLDSLLPTSSRWWMPPIPEPIYFERLHKGAGNSFTLLGSRYRDDKGIGFSQTNYSTEGFMQHYLNPDSLLLDRTLAQFAYWIRPLGLKPTTNGNFLFWGEYNPLFVGLNGFRAGFLNRFQANNPLVISTKETSLAQPAFFPNPTIDSKVRIRNTDPTFQYTLTWFNLLGQQLGTSSFSGNVEQVALPAIAKGTIFYQLTDQKGNFWTGKLIVK